MWGLGFEMDCYESYLNLYPNNSSPNLPQKEIEDIILYNLNNCDISIVGNYIFLDSESLLIGAIMVIQKKEPITFSQKHLRY